MTIMTDIAITGARPYGLSPAAHLCQRGTEHTVFGPVMDFWKSCMPDGMVLKSAGCASSFWDPQGHFTLRRYCPGQQPPLSGPRPSGAA